MLDIQIKVRRIAILRMARPDLFGHPNAMPGEICLHPSLDQLNAEKLTIEVLEMGYSPRLHTLEKFGEDGGIRFSLFIPVDEYIEIETYHEQARSTRHRWVNQTHVN